MKANIDFYFKFFIILCDVNKFEEVEMETDFHYLTLAEKEPVDCIRSELKAECEQLRSEDCTDSFTADAGGTFVRPNLLCQTIKIR